MDIQKAQQALKRGELESVYLILGTERFFGDQFQRDLTKVVVQEGDEFNIASFDMLEIPLGAALEEANSVPFFGERRLVFITNPYFLTGEKKTGGPEHDIEALLNYLASPSPTTILVIVAPYEKLDERKKITKQIKKSAALIEVKALDEGQTRKYLQSVIEDAGYKIEPAGLNLFLELADFQLSKVMNELPKLFLYRSDTKEIGKEDVHELVPKSLEQNLFDLTNFVMAGNVSQALTLYHDLLLQGEETIKLNAILESQFRLYIQVKIFIGEHFGQKEIAEQLKIHPYRVKLAMEQVRRYPLSKLTQVLDDLIENEYKMKTGQMDKELLFELFLLSNAMGKAG